MCARTTERTCMCVLHKLPLGWSPPITSRRVLAAPSFSPLFLPHHPSCLSLSLSCRHTVFNNDITGIIRDSQRGKIRCEPAPNQAQRAPPVIFPKDLSRCGGRCGGNRAEGSLYAAKGFLARGRQEGRAAAARKPLEPVLREFFYTRPWFSSRRTCRRVILLKDDLSPLS